MTSAHALPRLGRAVRTGLLVVAWATAGVTASRADAGEPSPPDYLQQATTRVEFVIVKSTTSFTEARRAAQVAAARLGLPLNLRGVSPTTVGDLSFAETTCRANGWDAPCYVARGRGDAGLYVSIESSRAYPEFKPGLYVVIVASGPPGDPALRRSLDRARKLYPDAYRKPASVYQGCLH